MPTREEILKMNLNYHEEEFLDVGQTYLSVVFKNKAPSDAVDLLESLLFYSPSKRVTAYEAMKRQFFYELRNQGMRLNNNDPPFLIGMRLKLKHTLKLYVSLLLAGLVVKEYFTGII
ncbi:hypothetical protein SteCoe_17281 [Stentor coeruleus]|uniref:Uncharacterized protein n=1 Tax=Stentor coeruleus TaxID=5963 RepID=A0A1R2BZL9_9CILI|nr:hypothetical protein SteCoe_17281 [Stentor coeruleus]